MGKGSVRSKKQFVRQKREISRVGGNTTRGERFGKNPSFPNRITPKKEQVYGSVVRSRILEKLSFLSYL